MLPRTPSEKFAIEVRALLYRWTEESDLDDLELAETAAKTINSWLDDEFIVFEADEDFFQSDEDLDGE